MSMKKGVKGDPCTHNSWLVKDTETEFGEVLFCTKCDCVVEKKSWIASLKGKKEEMGSLVFDVAMLYAVAYMFLLIVYVCLGGN